MQGKRVDAVRLEGALSRFLEDDKHLLFGFEKHGEQVVHRLFQNGVEGHTLFNPFFGVTGAIYLRRLFSKAPKIIAILRPCEIRAYVGVSRN